MIINNIAIIVVKIRINQDKLIGFKSALLYINKSHTQHIILKSCTKNTLNDSNDKLRNFGYSHKKDPSVHPETGVNSNIYINSLQYLYV